jgi:murein DD-endopeptidase MepM/ murein hydrolase activator NlpD
VDDPVQSVGLAPGTIGLDGQAGTAPAQNRDADRAQIKRLAQEFEAMLMTQMLREMRRSMASEGEPDGGGFGRDMMTDTIDVELGQALSRVGGFGLAGVLLKGIERSGGEPQSSAAAPVQAAPDAPDVPVAAAPPPVSTLALPMSPPADPAPAVPAAGTGELKVPDGTVTSAYGWRRDPFTGAPQFHKGIDVAALYGQNVPVAAAGRVLFAGNGGSYGTMVVVEHGPGQQTRYAHLSAVDVRAGDQVISGQVIGKTGDSGRSTGPHLHFEVLTDGQPVDPAAQP